MSFIIGAVTLPRYPERIQYSVGADIKSYMYPGALPLLISFGNKADVLTLEGRLQAIGSTKANLETNYINPLKALVATQVTLAAPDGRYDDTDWVFVKFDFDERPGWSRSFYIRCEFWKGSDITIL